MVEAVVHAASREVASRLPYYPTPDREDHHRECLRAFALQVVHFDRALFPPPWPTDWSYLFPASDEVCPRHGLYRHEQGCMVCADDPAG